MSNGDAVELPKRQMQVKVEPSNMTVREAVAKLVMSEDMDAELCLSIHNSDPIPVTDITDTGDGQVTVS